MKRIANFFQADLLPQHPPRIFVFGLIYTRVVLIFCVTIGAHIGRYINITAAIFEIQNIYCNITFPLASALQCLIFIYFFIVVLAT